jgi:DNA uptake protein ComE-like DNA-binding protein
LALRGKKSADPAAEWLIDPADGPSKAARSRPAEVAPDEPSEGQAGRESIGAETAQWIVPSTGANGLAADKTRPRKRKGARTTSAKRGVTKKHVQRVEKELEKQREENAYLAEQIRELEDAAEEYEEREDELRDRIRELEADLADATKKTRAAKPATATRRGTTPSKTTTESRARAKSSGRAKPASSRAAKSSQAKQASSKNGELDLNGATFEELRNLGLSVTQSARMIAYRDVRGGFQSLDELDDIPGLSAETRRDLKGRLQLGS